jgi:hypothetical protein
MKTKPAKNITRAEAIRRLNAAGIETKVVFGTSISAKVNRCSVSVFCTDTNRRNVRIDEARVHPLNGIGGNAIDAVKTAKMIRERLGCRVGFETGSIVYRVNYL